MLPTDTVPKLTAAGLALSGVEGAELEVVAVEVVEGELELLLRLVTPVQPQRIMVDIKSVELRERVKAWGVGRAEHVFLQCVGIMPRV